VARFTLRPRFARRLPDPFYNSTHGTERHILFVRAAELPSGISTAPGLKPLKTRWDVYKDVQASLIDKDCTPGTFHLKNQGITIVARSVRKSDEEELDVELGDAHGIIDGTHTYRLIIDAQQNPDVTLPREQYVKVEILTRVPDEWVAEVAAALNTPIVSAADGLGHVQDAIAWIKTDLESEPYFRSISWSENERGVYDVRDVLSMLTCFNTTFYANTESAHPIVAYENRSVVLSSFEKDFRATGGKAYKKLRPLLKSILMLHDTIQLEFPKYLTQAHGGDTALIERATKTPFEFPFLQTRSTERLATGALLPVLAAFRWLVDDDPATGLSQWRGGLQNVLERWRGSAPRLAAQTLEKAREVGDDPNTIGRSASHWSALHKEIAFVDLMGKQASRPAASPATSGP